MGIAGLLGTFVAVAIATSGAPPEPRNDPMKTTPSRPATALELEAQTRMWRGWPPRICAAGACEARAPVFCVAQGLEGIHIEKRRDPCAREPSFRVAGSPGL